MIFRHIYHHDQNNVIIGLKRWLQRRQSQPAVQEQTDQALIGEDSLALTVSQVEGPVPVTVFRLQGNLDASNYRAVITRAKAIYDSSSCRLVFDMSEMTFLGICGVTAIHSIARILNGKEPFDPEAGWSTWYAIRADLEIEAVHPYFKLCNPQPVVEQTLERVGFNQHLECHHDLETAIASF